MRRAIIPTMSLTAHVHRKRLREFPVHERVTMLGLGASDAYALRSGLSLDVADHMIENVVATHAELVATTMCPWQ